MCTVSTTVEDALDGVRVITYNVVKRTIYLRDHRRMQIDGQYKI